MTSGGRLLHAHMQPGSGSWDPLLSLIYTKMLDDFLFQADVIYQYTTRNRQGYEFGDSAALNLNANYAVIWISTGLHVFPFKNLVLDAKAQVPVWEKVNGIQLVSRYRIVLGLRTISRIKRRREKTLFPGEDTMRTGTIEPKSPSPCPACSGVG